MYTYIYIYIHIYIYIYIYAYNRERTSKRGPCACFISEVKVSTGTDVVVRHLPAA